MKRKITYLITTVALVMGAFLVGKSTQLNHSIPTEDIACHYTNADGYITVELKDVTHQLDNKANASYTDLLKDIPNETEAYKNNMVNMSKVTDFSATETSLQIYLDDGSGYYWER